MITIMISSTVKDLLPDRYAILSAFDAISFVQIIGTEPIRTLSYTASPYLATIEMAQNCGLFILILGGKYGYSIKDGKSATEIEFDSAYKVDPTKILVFQKDGVKAVPKQHKLITKISNYYKGYWITRYSSIDELQKIVIASFGIWIKERALIGYKVSYFDHFIRLATQRSPLPSSQILYAVSDNYVEVQYKVINRTYAVHFDKLEIYNDFWGSIASLERFFEQWRREHFGRDL